MKIDIDYMKKFALLGKNIFLLKSFEYIKINLTLNITGFKVDAHAAHMVESAL